MDDFGKKTVVAAIAIVCLTIAIITSFSVGNIVYPIKSIIKNIENDNSYTQNSAQILQFLCSRSKKRNERCRLYRAIVEKSSFRRRKGRFALPCEYDESFDGVDCNREFAT